MTLNGYTLKAVKMMPSFDGVCFSGNIYFENKKIGMAHNDGNGGMTNVQLLPEYRDHYPILNEDFVERLFTLNDYEKIYKAETKKQQNKAVAFVTYSNYFDLSYYTLGQNGNEEGLRTHIQKSNPERGDIESIEIFRSLDDFNVTQSFETAAENKAEATAETDLQEKMVESANHTEIATHDLSFTTTQLTTIRSALTNFLTIDSGDYISEETAKIIDSVVEQIDSTIEPPHLSKLLDNIPLDFHYLSTNELEDVYKKLLAIGKENDLTADENACLQALVNQSGKILMNRSEYEPENETEPEAEQEAEI